MGEFYEVFVEKINEVVADVLASNNESIKKAGELIANSIMNGGILQAFGSGHSYCAAVEICGRAGGLIPSKAINEPARGMYEMLEGTGVQFCKKLDTDKNDVFVIISTSGRNPLGIEIADHVKKQGIPIIVVTSLEVSKSMSSRHSSGKHLYDFADVVLDVKGVHGDAIVEVEGMPEKVMGTSSIASMMLLDCAVLHSIKLMLEAGYTPPVYRSANIDGGPEFNDMIVEKYKHRLRMY